MKIESERIAHMHKVAEYMYKHAKEYGFDAEKMYILGLLHDVGCIRDKKDHETHSADICEEMGINKEYTDVIRYHGQSPDRYCKDHKITEKDIPAELLLLWEADLHTGPSGEYMTYEERIDDMIARHKKLIENDPHVGLSINEDGLITAINYHETYGTVAKEVVELLKTKNRI